MKRIFFIVLVLFAFQNCGPSYNIIKIQEGKQDNTEHDRGLSPNELVVRWKPGMTKADKDEQRSKYHVLDSLTCSCGDTTLEMWKIDPAFDIEETARNLKDDSGRGGVSGGDRQMPIELADVEFKSPKEPNLPRLSDPFDGQFKVNIAVIDTGIDYTGAGSADPYLYDSGKVTNCVAETSGWNFLNGGSSNVLDDHGHGTYITKLITSTLDTMRIGYRILPIKAFDERGQGSYWDVVCAMGYVKTINEKGGNINIVNASFGRRLDRTLLDGQQLLDSLIKELRDETLVVTSAGNFNNNNDDPDFGHFPSSYEADNILAVGGFDMVAGKIQKHLLSNYGKISIDVAAPYAGYRLIFNNPTLSGPGDLILMEGTSYGTAYISAHAAQLYRSDATPQEIRNQILTTAIQNVDGLNSYINGGRAFK